MKILVTGANGFLGRGIVQCLARSDHTVIAVDFSDFKVTCDNVISKTVNLFELKDPFAELESPDIVVHLAWRDGFKHNSDAHIEDLPKHYRFLQKMIEGGVSKLVVMGTMHEVGFHEGSINENTPCKPLSLYGIAKNSLRQMLELRVKDEKVKLQWVRGYYIVDNTANGCSIFSKLIGAANEGKKEFPFTSGINQYDFLNYDVFCSQVAAVVLNNEEFGIINCCSGRPQKLADRVEQFIMENSLDISLKYGAYPDRPYDSLAVWGDDAKIKRIMESAKER